MNKQENPSRFLERAAGFLELPADAVAGVFRMEWTGWHELLLENHKGILEYSDTEIKVSAGNTVIRVQGRNLNLESMNAAELRLSGTLETVSLLALSERS